MEIEDFARRSIFGVTTALNSSKLNSDCFESFLRSSRATSRALICRRPDFFARVMIFSRESTKLCYSNSLSRFCFVTERFSVFCIACLAAALASALPPPPPPANGFNLFYSAVKAGLFPPPASMPASGFSRFYSAVRAGFEAAAGPFFSSAAPPAASIGFKRSCSAVSPLLLRSAFAFGGALFTLRVSGAALSGYPLTTSLSPASSSAGTNAAWACGLLAGFC